jgi:hypothetical protein
MPRRSRLKHVQPGTGPTPPGFFLCATEKVVSRGK